MGKHKQLVNEGNTIKVVEMRGVDSRIVYSSKEDTDIENLCEMIKFNAYIENS
jgi:hypothetical protein